MFACDGAVDAATVVARLSLLVDELQSLDLTCLPGAGVLELMRGLEIQKNRLATVDHCLIAELDSRALAREHACHDTATLLNHLLRISPNEATGRVRAAADLGPRRGLTGQFLPPLFERVAAAQRVGRMSPAHARIVRCTIDQLPAAVQAQHEASAQEFLVEEAQVLDPRQLARVAHRLRDTLDPDGTLATERDRGRRRELNIRHRPDGSSHVEGELTAICTEALLAVLEPLTKPVPAQDGAKDPRSAGQRRHDALHDAMLVALRSEQLPACNGVVATILLTMTAEQCQSRTGLVTTGRGARIPAKTALTLAGEARIIPVALGKTREITGYGTAHRIFTEGQRLAMIARDQGCSFPGCTAAPAWCQAHHVTDFAISHRTSVDDGTLLCGFHHREHPALGWTCRMIDGRAHWTPPSWIDPGGAPRRNQAHEPLRV